MPSRFGPRELNEAIASFRSLAPTVIALGVVARTGDGLGAGAAVARGDDADDTGPDGGVERVVRGLGVRGAAQRHGDDISAVLDGPLDALDDVAVLAGAVLAEHLGAHQAGFGGYALVLAVSGGACARDGAGAVGAVAVVVVRRGLTAHVVHPADDFVAVQVGVARVDTCVDDADLDALAGVPGSPDLVAADLRYSLVEQGLHSPVFLDVLDIAHGLELVYLVVR